MILNYFFLFHHHRPIIMQWLFLTCTVQKCMMCIINSTQGYSLFRINYILCTSLEFFFAYENKNSWSWVSRNDIANQIENTSSKFQVRSVTCHKQRRTLGNQSPREEPWWLPLRSCCWWVVSVTGAIFMMSQKPASVCTVGLVKVLINSSHIDGLLRLWMG